MRRSSLVPMTISLAAAAVLSGCTVAQFHRVGPQSHFAYPNSNVKALGPVDITTKGTTSVFFAPSWITSEADIKVYNEALAQVDGSNIIIDYIRTTTLKQWPGLAIWWTEESLEGTAARMEVGQQDLK